MKEKNFVQGEKYKLELSNSSMHEGIFVFENNEFIYLKLNSGYNMGILKKNIKSCVNMDLEDKSHLLKESSSKLHANSHKSFFDSSNIISENTQFDKDSEIIILHTGGTIASKVDYSTGAVNAKFTPSEMISLFPELKDIAKIDSKLISNMPSDDLNFYHYNEMAKAIELALALKSIKGIILTQGTDTVHYTSSALSFMFENLPIPIVIVGAQRSSDRPSSDSALNLLSAAYFISKSKENNTNGVFICMHESSSDDSCVILPAHNVRKLHSTRRDAFKVISGGIFAKVNFENKSINFLHNNMQYEPATIKNKILKLFDPSIKVGIIRSRPGLLPEELKIYEKFDGLILEGTGLGHFPIDQFDESTKQNKEILKIIEEIASKKVACMTSQTVFGRINLNVYSPGRTLKDLGVLGHNLNMTTETAYIKLVWLLSNYSLDDTKKLYSKNLRGEILDRLENEDFL